MGMEVLGIVASFATIVSGFGWLLDKNHKKIEDMLRYNGQNLTGLVMKVEKIESSFNDLRAEIPEKFVTKTELLTHMRNEEKWQRETHDQLMQIREEISALRQWTAHEHCSKHLALARPPAPLEVPERKRSGGGPESTVQSGRLRE
jgi:hypothetical protein